HPSREIEPLLPRSVTIEAAAATEVKETRESEEAAAPTEVKRTQKRQEKPWVKPGCSSVQACGTWKRTELTPGHAPTPKPSVVRRQQTIVPRHKYSSYSHLLAQPSLASSFGQVSHRETPKLRPRDLRRLPLKSRSPPIWQFGRRLSMTRTRLSNGPSSSSRP
ncbi:hypothetical protein LTR95_019585, partial [Oleoguttula sp. CCFEE 5521]